LEAAKSPSISRRPYPPHFHVVGVEFDALVEIETMLVIRGNVVKAQDAMDWAHENRDIIRAEWERCNGR